MKKTILSLISLSFLIFPVLVTAVPPARVDITGTINHITDWIFGILLLVAALMLILAGFNFITAEGDAEKISGARNKVLYALIGVVVAFASRGLVHFVQSLIVRVP